jgi:hypothetical protein
MEITLRVRVTYLAAVVTIGVGGDQNAVIDVETAGHKSTGVDFTQVHQGRTDHHIERQQRNDRIDN